MPFWTSQKSSIYAGIQILDQVTAHLEELRRRGMYVLAAFAIGFGLAFFFAQPLLGFIIRPIRVIQPTTPTSVPINTYVLAQDLKVNTTPAGAANPVTTTVTIPAGTTLYMSLASTTPIVSKPTELFTTYVQIAIIAGVGTALPMVLLQAALFLLDQSFRMRR